MGDDKHQRWKLPLIGVLVVIVIPIGAWAISSLTPIGYLGSISILETIGTVGLSALLAYLYVEIRNIQSNQEDLMEVQYEPNIKATISSGSEDFPVVLIRNTGLATAINLDVSIRVGDNDRHGSHPFLGPNETIEYPVYSESNPLPTDEIIDRIDIDPDDESDGPFSDDRDPIAERLYCKISCEDVKRDSHDFEETFDIEKLLRGLKDYKKRSEVDALEDVSYVLEGIRDELKTANNDIL